jgi:GxxExxY protein
VTENELSREMVDAAYRIHTTLGPGLLESVYVPVLAWDLERRGLRVARQVEIPVVYERVRMEAGFRADLVVDDKVIVEVKSVETVMPVHKKQLLTYLRLADKRLGVRSTSMSFSLSRASRESSTACRNDPAVLGTIALLAPY